MAYSAAAWSRPIGSDAVGLDCTWGLPHSDTGDWFSVCDVILAGSWVRKQGCTPEIVLIRGEFSMPVVGVQLCCEVFSI